MTGFPSPVVTWRKAQGSLAKDRIFRDGGLLTVVLTEKHDIGSYICHTKNYLGETSAATSLVVLSVPKFITRPPASVSRIAGSGLSLNCSAIGDPTTTVSWKRSEGAWVEERMNVSHEVDLWQVYQRRGWRGIQREYRMPKEVQRAR